VQSWIFSTCMIGTPCNSSLLTSSATALLTSNQHNSQTPFHIAANSQGPFFLSNVVPIQIDSLRNALASFQPRYSCTKEHHFFQDSNTNHYKPIVHLRCKCIATLSYHVVLCQQLSSHKFCFPRSIRNNQSPPSFY